MDEIPIIDVAPLVTSGVGVERVATQIDAACRRHGFFYVVGHGVDPSLQARLDRCARAFFALPTAEKERIAMRHGGRAWRGWFALGDELTSGVPDRKEGIYFGTELGKDDPRVQAGTPMHGANLFPAEPVELRALVLAWIDACTVLAHRLVAGIALGLGLGATWFAEHGTADPLILFRIFRYPPAVNDTSWGVGEHTDYGLLTIVAQDDTGGLEVKVDGRWIAAPPVPGAFVCNIGDMLDRMTRGVYRSTPHRVNNGGARERISLPFFFDPGFAARVQPIPRAEAAPDDAASRWDGRSVHAFDGTYGEYLLDKVGRVFPQLFARVL